MIARVRLDSVSSSAESGTTRFGTKYIAVPEFNLSVEEYLKGSGADDIVAVWNSVPVFDTLQEAEDALPAIAAARDAQWDDREAIVFLQNSRAYLPSTQEVGRFFLSGKTNFDDNYSIGSRHHTLWLPAVAAVGDSSQPHGGPAAVSDRRAACRGNGPHHNPGGDQDADCRGHGKAQRR